MNQWYALLSGFWFAELVILEIYCRSYMSFFFFYLESIFDYMAGKFHELDPCYIWMNALKYKLMDAWIQAYRIPCLTSHYSLIIANKQVMVHNWSMKHIQSSWKHWVKYDFMQQNKNFCDSFKGKDNKRKAWKVE